MTQQQKHPARGVAFAGIVAALYVALTMLISLIPGFATSAIQVRISEALCILTFFTPWAIPGLTIGCFLSNLLLGCVWQDILFGTLATLIGAVGGWLLRKVSIWLVPIPTVLANAIIVPFVLKYAYNAPDAVPLMMLTVGLGELIAAFGLGMTLYFALKPHEKRLFKPFT
ncbi:MAG: QueT transporter family protein [Clostridia bacterium]|nr:QueT transporter family protein [Clostridia bacterium]